MGQQAEQTWEKERGGKTTFSACVAMLTSAKTRLLFAAAIIVFQVYWYIKSNFIYHSGLPEMLESIVPLGMDKVKFIINVFLILFNGLLSIIAVKLVFKETSQVRLSILVFSIAFFIYLGLIASVRLGGLSALEGMKDDVLLFISSPLLTIVLIPTCTLIKKQIS